jgi:hypothetical protein
VPQGEGNTWIVCPTTAMAEWAGTIAKNSTRGVQMIGSEFTHLGGGTIESRGKGTKHTRAAARAPDRLQHHRPRAAPGPAEEAPRARRPDQGRARHHRRVAEDEEREGRPLEDARPLLEAHDRAVGAVGHDRREEAEGLRRPVQVGEPGQVAQPRRDGGEVRQGQAVGAPHVLGEDKVRQFREGVDEGLYQLGADDANLPGQTDQEHKVELDPEHKQALQKLADNINHVRAEAKERGLQGISGIDADRMMKQALYEKPGNAILKELADADRRVAGVRLRRRAGRRRERRHLRAEAHRLQPVRQAARPRRRRALEGRPEGVLRPRRPDQRAERQGPQGLPRPQGPGGPRQLGQEQHRPQPPVRLQQGQVPVRGDAPAPLLAAGQQRDDPAAQRPPAPQGRPGPGHGPHLQRRHPGRDTQRDRLASSAARRTSSATASSSSAAARRSAGGSSSEGQKPAATQAAADDGGQATAGAMAATLWAMLQHGIIGAAALLAALHGDRDVPRQGHRARGRALVSQVRDVHDVILGDEETPSPRRPTRTTATSGWARSSGTSVDVVGQPQEVNRKVGKVEGSLDVLGDHERLEIRQRSRRRRSPDREKQRPRPDPPPERRTDGDV